MPLQNVFILNVYQIANPACQWCNLSYKFHSRKLFLCFILNSFLVDAASQCGLCFTSHSFQALCCLAFPFLLAGLSPKVGAISLLEQTVPPHQLLLATSTYPTA